MRKIEKGDDAGWRFAYLLTMKASSMDIVFLDIKGVWKKTHGMFQCYLVQVTSSCKILDQTDKRSKNESNN